jgi:hypothetical protein
LNFHNFPLMDLSKNTLTTSHGATFCIYYDPQNTIPICRNGSLESFQRSVVWIETSLLRGFDGEIDPISLIPRCSITTLACWVYMYFMGGWFPPDGGKGFFCGTGESLGKRRFSLRRRAEGGGRRAVGRGGRD